MTQETQETQEVSPPIEVRVQVGYSIIVFAPSIKDAVSSAAARVPSNAVQVNTHGYLKSDDQF